MKFSTPQKLVILVSIVMTAIGCNQSSLPFEKEDSDLIDLLESRTPNNSLSDLILPNTGYYAMLPQDPNNPITNDKVELGKLLYHETGISINPKNAICYKTYSCASCHHVDAGFQSGLKQGIADGGEGFGIAGEGRHKISICPDTLVDVQPLKSPSTLNSAYQTNQLWNGQFGATHLNAGTEDKWVYGTPIAVNKLGYEGVETQAIAGFSVHRLGIDTALLFTEPYKSFFENAYPHIQDFNALPEDEMIELIGLSIAAYERTLVASLSPYQRWLKGDYDVMTSSQKAGMNLFYSKAECYTCHAGPALNSMEFHAIGVNDLEGSDVVPVDGTGAAKGRGGFTGNSEDDYKFKVPQIYNLRDARFYGHGSSFSSIREIIEYKNAGVAENANVPASQLAVEFHALNLSDEEIDQLVDFIENGLYDSELKRYVPESVPSGNCIPNNDAVAKQEICD